jgi:organic hydroperoxide reductase OsmC/OhrA
MHEHRYSARMVWDGNRGTGTAAYNTYGRDYHVTIEGKPALDGSADPAFRGDAAKWNPEDMLVGAVMSCHMLSYLALCSWEKIPVVGYEDSAEGLMRTDRNGGGRFESITLHPRVTIEGEEHRQRATELHARAHELCFIASSCNFPIHHEATIEVRE